MILWEAPTSVPVGREELLEAPSAVPLVAVSVSLPVPLLSDVVPSEAGVDCGLGIIGFDVVGSTVGSVT